VVAPSECACAYKAKNYTKCKQVQAKLKEQEGKGKVKKKKKKPNLERLKSLSMLKQPSSPTTAPKTCDVLNCVTASSQCQL